VTTRLKPVDVVVVGMGVAGTIIAKELAQSQLRVVGLERGRMLEPQHEFALPYAHDELKFGRHTDLMQNLARETLTFRNTMDETALPMREMGSFMLGECVGGAGVRWGGVTWRFSPWDFETRSRTIARYGKEQLPADCTSQDWGISYDELEPYYDQFEYLYGIGGKAGNLDGEIQPGGNPFEGPRSREFPNPPAAQTYAGSLFAEAAQRLGYTPFPQPTAAMTRPYINPYKLHLGECARGGFCARHGCSMDAKATPLTTVLPALLKHENFELRTHANVIKVNLDSDGKRAVGVTYIDARGREVEQPADLVILTSYVFNNARLLLLSGIGQPYDPVSGRGVVGRNYAYQTNGHVPMFFEDKVFNRFMGGGGIGVAVDEFNGDNFDHTGLGFIGGAYLSAVSMGAAPIRSHPVPEGTPNWGAGWKKAVAHYYDRTFQIVGQGGCQSYRTHYLDLDPTYRDAYGLPLIRMTFDWHEQEKAMSRFTTGKAAEIARAIGPSTMGVYPVTGKYSIVPYQSTHNTGGVAMGDDPATSAVNKYLQSWDVSNVFVIGASAFPQNSANNPTSTVGALACWAADAIKDTYLRRPGSLV
jgi:gluconate 2-dehydrogenase alpha chain